MIVLVSRIVDPSDDAIGRVTIADPKIGIERNFAYSFFTDKEAKKYLFITRVRYVRRLIIYDAAGMLIVYATGPNVTRSDIDPSIMENRTLCEILKLSVMFGILFYDEGSDEYKKNQHLISSCSEWFVSHKQVWDGLELTLNLDFIGKRCNLDIFKQMLSVECAYLGYV